MTGTVTDGAGKPVARVAFAIRMPCNLNNRWYGEPERERQFTSPAISKAISRYPACPRAKARSSLYRQPVTAAGNSRRRCLSKCRQRRRLPSRSTRVVLHTMRGRVLDMRQHPLAGVSATFNVRYRQDRGPQPVTVVTGEDGGYQLEKIPLGHDISLLSLVKAGYRQRTYTLTQCGQRRFRRCPDGGVRHRGARQGVRRRRQTGGRRRCGLSMESGRSVRAVTDAAGAFTLTEQPEEKLHLVAATPAGGGLATCTAKMAGDRCPHHLHVRADLPQPVDIPLAVSLLDADGKLPKNQRRFNRADTLHIIADTDLELALRLSQTGNEPAPDGLRAYLLARQAAKDPAKVDGLLVQLNMLTAARLQALCRRRNRHCRGEKRSRVGRAVISHREADL